MYNKTQSFSSEISNVGIHTVSGTTKEVVDYEEMDRNILIKEWNSRETKNEVYMRVNPNIELGGYIIDAYSEFKEVTQDLFSRIGVQEVKWKRVDLSFNALDDRYYENYTKLNRLLIACIADSASDSNTYDTKDFWNGKTKSLATKNQYREVEFYDKKAESMGKSPYRGRLELRSKRINGSVEHEFLDVWGERLDKAVRHFSDVQDRFNVNMAQSYKEDLAKAERDRDYQNVTGFLMARRDYIFTSTQMKSLLMMIGMSETKATNKAYNFKKDHSIEYFKEEDLKFIVSEIKKKIAEYFSR